MKHLIVKETGPSSVEGNEFFIYCLLLSFL